MILNNERLQPTLGDFIKCDCHNKECAAGMEINSTGMMVELTMYGQHGNVISVLLDLNHALDVALIMQEAASDVKTQV